MEIPDLTTFAKVRTADKEEVSNKFIDVDGASIAFYEKEIEGALISAGLYSLDDIPIHLSWGVKVHEECDYHAIMFVEPSVIYEGCIDLALYGNKILVREEDKDYGYIIPEIQ